MWRKAYPPCFQQVSAAKPKIQGAPVRYQPVAEVCSGEKGDCHRFPLAELLCVQWSGVRKSVDVPFFSVVESCNFKLNLLKTNGF